MLNCIYIDLIDFGYNLGKYFIFFDVVFYVIFCNGYLQSIYMVLDIISDFEMS